MIISGINLGKLVKDFNLCVDSRANRPLKEVQAEIPVLIKLINEQVMGQKKSMVSELSFDGFVEYLLQHANQYFNVHLHMREKRKKQTAVELTESLVGWIRDVNEERNLRLNKRYFDKSGAEDPAE